MKLSDLMRESASVRHTISADEYGAGRACQIIESKDEKLLKAADLLDECERLLARYRTETPLGNQPHMIAAEAAATLAKLRAAQERS